MQQPPLEDLLKKTGSKYTLVVVAAKWAREIIKREDGEEEVKRKPVSMAMEDIMAGRVQYERVQG
jgi:DNA-directed RNA polymerase subunit omega